MHHCDLESNGLWYHTNRVWILVSYDDELDKWHISFDYKEWYEKPVVQWLTVKAKIYNSHTEHLNYLKNQEVNFHNYFGFDKQVIRKFIPDWLPKGEHDTYILSQLLNPDRGKHGLDEWGIRLGIPKPKYEDWAGGLTEGMVVRCIEDVKITKAVWDILIQEAQEWNWGKPVELEYRIADIIGRQQCHGTMIDSDKAYELADWLWSEVQRLGDTIVARMPWKVKRGTEYKRQPLCGVSFSQPNINSFQQVKEYLLSQGWQPSRFTDKGSPQITEDTFHTIKGETGQSIARRSVLKHRAQMIYNLSKGVEKGLLGTMRPDGRVEASAETNGTNTGRFKHRAPCVNIPKPKDVKKYGLPYDIRELFIAPRGRLLMGIDADGLEARMMCHYILPFDGGEEYSEIVLEGDIHQHNAEIFGTDRDGAKSPYYCILYGGQIPTFALTLSCDIDKATKLFYKFWEESVALKSFKDSITAHWRKNNGFIVGIDGRKILIRSEHAIVNAAFQSAGSIVVKKATVLMDQKCRAAGLTAQQVLHFHDEFTYELPPEEQELVGKFAEESFVEAGKLLNIRVPVTGSPVFGKNWKEIH